AGGVAAGRIALSLEISGAPGELLRIVGRDDAGHSSEVLWEQPLNAARKHALTESLVQEQFGRLGGTPFRLAGIRFLAPEGQAAGSPLKKGTGTSRGHELAGGLSVPLGASPLLQQAESLPVMVPKSVLNDLRRRLVAQL